MEGVSSPGSEPTSSPLEHEVPQQDSQRHPAGGDPQEHSPQVDGHQGGALVCQQRANRRDQIVDPEGLEQGGDAAWHPLGTGVRTTGDPQDRHCWAEFPHEDRELRSAEMGHPAISDQQVESALFGEFPSLEAIRGFDHFILFGAERAGSDAAEGGLVLYQQNTEGHAALSEGGE